MNGPLRKDNKISEVTVLKNAKLGICSLHLILCKHFDNIFVFTGTNIKIVGEQSSPYNLPPGVKNIYNYCATDCPTKDVTRTILYLPTQIMVIIDQPYQFFACV